LFLFLWKRAGGGFGGEDFFWILAVVVCKLNFP
jgi:hypothetical protein